MRCRVARAAALGGAVSAVVYAVLSMTDVASAQTYPARRITIVVPYTPGSGFDMTARQIGQKMAERWGQPVVIDNKPGASGSIGTESVANAPADGYTLLVTGAPHTVFPSMSKTLRFDPAASFSPLGTVGTGGVVLVVNPNALPVKSLAAFVAEIKARPGQLNYSSPGIGTVQHLGMELLKQRLGLNVVHVPYRGASTALTDLVSGQIQFAYLPVHTALPHARDGKLRMLAVASDRRSPFAPDVPTFAELGHPDVAFELWYGFFGPAGLPAPVVQHWEKELAAVTAQADTKEGFEAQGMMPGFKNAAATGAMLRPRSRVGARWWRKPASSQNKPATGRRDVPRERDAATKQQDRTTRGEQMPMRIASHAGRALIRCAAGMLAVLAACVASPGAQAAYPDRPITLIVPFAPGGPTDIIARILATSLSQSLGQQVIVDNRGGAAGNIGMGQAARSAPDGYTLLLASTAIAVNPALFKSLPYDPFRDFAPISELVNAPNVLVVRPDSGITSVADLVKRAKAEPERFNYSSPGAGTKSHLTGELLKLRSGIEMVHVPFRGAGPAAQAVLANTTQVGSVALAAADALIREGQLRPLAVTSAKRWFSLPDVPTMIEAGYPDFVSDTFNALFAPAGTPPEIIALLVKESRAAFQKPEAREMARKAGFEVVAGTPEQLAARVASEVPAVRDLVARAGIKTE